MKRIVPVKKDGSALLITLAAVALLTVVILAFFSRAEISRKVSFSSTNQIKTGMLAGSACDIITGQLRQQIADGSLSGATYTVGDTAVYIPIDASYAVPKKQAGLKADTVGANTILYVSGNGATLNPYASFPLALGSSVTIDTPSRNGRKETNWFTNGPRLGSADITPTWVYLTQGQGIATAPSLTAKATEPDYIVGRFAYTVYDVSGLLDANVAGYPSVMDSDSNHYPSFKSCPAYADLSVAALGANANQLVSWRNPGDGGSASAYQSYLDNWGLKYGFLQTKVGSNAFLSRQDFLNAVDNGIAGFSSASASYFTANSCSVDAPSWSPATPSGASVDYAALAEAGTSANRDIPNVRILSSGTSTHYRDDGTSYTYSVQDGDVLIQRRFSLAKLAWITDTGPKTGISSAAIQACFGLSWDSTNKRWNYVGPTGSTTLSAIATLKDVAAAKREPNFFELLQAGILSSSIGKSATNNSLALTTVFDKNPTLQVIQIGANIIDQSDTDDYPTAIRIINSTNSQAWDAFGIEDLPGLNSVYMSYYRPVAGGPTFSNNATRDTLHVWLLAELWNPHQNSTSRSGSMSLRATVNDGTMSTQVLRSGSANLVGTNGSSRNFSTSPATLNFSCLPGGFREPGLLTPANSSGTTGDIFTDGVANFAGFHVGSITAPDKNFTHNTTDYNWTISAFGVSMPLTI